MKIKNKILRLGALLLFLLGCGSAFLVFNLMSHFNSDTARNLSSMLTYDDLLNQACIFIKNDDLIKLDDANTTWIMANKFGALTQKTVNKDHCRLQTMSNGAVAELVPLEETANALGYDVNTATDGVVLVRPYGSRSLIVKTTNNDLPTYGAIQMITEIPNLYLYRYATEEATMAAYQAYQNRDDVSLVTVDPIIYADSISDSEPFQTATTTNILPTFDTWGGAMIGADRYNLYLQNQTAALPEVVVAVLDSGIYTQHQRFHNRILIDADGIVGYDYTNAYVNINLPSLEISFEGYKTKDVEDHYGHGTHVAGIIADLTLPNVKILPLKILNDSGRGTGWSVLWALKDLSDFAQTYPILAANMSFGHTINPSEQLYENFYQWAIENLYQNNILSVVAAGNNSQNAATHSPAFIDKAITVSNINSKKEFYSSSNYGEVIDVCAPGVSIYNATISNSGNTNSKVSMTGTSMSTPHVTAALALLKSDPNKDYTVADLENYLITKSKDLGTPGKDIYYGYGLVDLSCALPEITITTMPADNGTISLENDDIAYGEDVTINFAPDVGYELVQVICNDLEIDLTQITNHTLTIPAVTQSLTISALFQPKKYQFNIIEQEGIAASTGSGTYYYGDNVVASVSMMPGCEFFAWVIDHNTYSDSIYLPPEATISFTMPASDLTLQAFTNIQAFEMTATITDNIGGEIIISDQYVEYGNSVVFSILPDVGYELTKVVCNDDVIDLSSLVDNHLTIENVVTDINLVATFEPIFYTLNITGNEGVDEITGAGRYRYGDEVAIAVTLYPGYEFYDWLVNNDNDDFKDYLIFNDALNFSFKMPANNLSLSIIATIRVFSVKAVVTNNNGGQVITSADTIEYGDIIVYTMTPEVGYEIYKVYFNQEDVTTKVIYDATTQTYRFTSEQVTVNPKFEVTFTPVKPPISTAQILIWTGGITLTVFLFGISGILLFLSFHKSKLPPVAKH